MASTTTKDELVDRLRHALVYMEEVRRALLEALNLIEAGRGAHDV